MAGNHKRGIGVVGMCGLVMILAGLVASVVGFANRGGIGLHVGASSIAMGVIFLAIGIANAGRAASASQGTGTQPSAPGGSDRD